MVIGADMVRGSEGDQMVGHMAGGLVLEVWQIGGWHEFW